MYPDFNIDDIDDMYREMPAPTGYGGYGGYGYYPGFGAYYMPIMNPGMGPNMGPMNPGMVPGAAPGMVPGMVPGAAPGMVPGMFPGAAPMQPSIVTTPLIDNSTSPFPQAPGSPTELDIEYTQGYLKTQIGKRVKIFFLIGTNIVQDRDGTLVDVGISYIVLREPQTNNLILCDIYSIKFVTIYQV